MDKLNAMQCFIAIVEEGSIIAAANRLGLTSPMIGKHLNNLETHLGMPLIYRTTRKQSLTEFGSIYYEKCKHILEEVKISEQVAELYSLEPIGKMKISVPLNLSNSRLAFTLANYAKHYPNLILNVESSNRIIDLISEDFEAAIRIGELPDSQLIARPLAPYQMVIVASTDYIKAQGAIQTIEKFFKCDFLGLEHWPNFGSWIDKLDIKNKPMTSPPLRFMASNSYLLKAATLQGLGIAYLPEFMVKHELEKGSLIGILPEIWSKPMPVNLVYPFNRQSSSKLKTLTEWLVKYHGGEW